MACSRGLVGQGHLWARAPRRQPAPLRRPPGPKTPLLARLHCRLPRGEAPRSSHQLTFWASPCPDASPEAMAAGGSTPTLAGDAPPRPQPANRPASCPDACPLAAAAARPGPKPRPPPPRSRTAAALPQRCTTAHQGMLGRRRGKGGRGAPWHAAAAAEAAASAAASWAVNAAPASLSPSPAIGRSAALIASNHFLGVILPGRLPGAPGRPGVNTHPRRRCPLWIEAQSRAAELRLQPAQQPASRPNACPRCRRRRAPRPGIQHPAAWLTHGRYPAAALWGR